MTTLEPLCNAECGGVPQLRCYRIRGHAGPHRAEQAVTQLSDGVTYGYEVEWPLPAPTPGARDDR